MGGKDAGNGRTLLFFLDGEEVWTTPSELRAYFRHCAQRSLLMIWNQTGTQPYARLVLSILYLVLGSLKLFL